jgi:hypothetical protein
MPNSGVFYKSGKFHISKLSTDLVEFAGKVEATGITLIDEMKTNSPLTGAATSIVLPTATQVVDYVQQVSSGATTYQLDAGSASSGEGEAFAYTLKPDTDSEKKRLDDMFDDFAGLIAQAASSSEVRDNVIEASAGLETDGSYAQHSGSNYIDSGTTLKAVDLLLDVQAKANADAIVTERSRAMGVESAIQAELDATQTGAGLGTAGAYAAHTGANYIAGASDLHGADLLLDTQAKTNADGIAQEIVDRSNADALLRSDVDSALGTSVPNFSVTASGLSTANGYNTAFNGAGDVVTALEALDSAIFAMLDGSTVNLDNLAQLVQAYENMDDDVFAMVNGIFGFTGMTASPTLNADGVANEVIAFSYSGTNYMDSAVTLKAADILLDSALKAEETARIAADGNLSFTYVDSNGAAASATDLTAAINELGAAVASSNTTVQAELDATQSALGMIADASASAGNGGYYMPSVTAPAASGTYFKVGSDINAGSSLVAMFGSVQSDMQSMSEAFEQEDIDINAELTATQLGAGLNTDGTYSANASADFIPLATSLQDADDKLDAALKAEEVRATGVEAAIQAELDATQSALGASISGLGVYAPHSGKNYINGNADLTEDIIDLDAKLKVEEDSLDASQADIFASGETLAADFSINGNQYSTIEGAIIAIGSSLGDSDMDFSADSGAGSVDLASEVMAITSAATGNTLQAPATNLVTAASAQSLTIKLKPEIQVDEVRAQFVQSAVVGSSISVQHAPFVADEAMDSGAIVCVQKGGTRKYGIENADIGDSAKIEILGMAFDPASTSGGITAHTFAAGDAVAIVKSGQNVEGVSFGVKDQGGNTLTYAVGDALYMGVDDQGNSCITKAIPSDDSNFGFDAKAVISLGFVSALSGTNGATADAMWFEVKLVAMEA